MVEEVVTYVCIVTTLLGLAIGTKAVLGAQIASDRLDDVRAIMRFLQHHDLREDVLYYVDDKDNIGFMVLANDLFSWGTADGEELTVADLPLFKKCVEDTQSYACDLYAARKRKMRPQGAAYPGDKSLWPLFDACGPERETGLGNPYTPESYLAKKASKKAQYPEQK